MLTPRFIPPRLARLLLALAATLLATAPARAIGIEISSPPPPPRYEVLPATSPRFQ